MTANYNAANPGNTQIRLVHQLFQNQALQTPDAVSVSFSAQQLTYQQLDEVSDLMAAEIVRQAFSSEIIAISTTRSIEMIAGILA
ncbi:MAG: hypothetical protein EOP44_06005, partial [Sphingobacteriaceae bacterium]